MEYETQQAPQQKPKKRKPRMKPFEKAINLLGRRGYAVKEMREALLKKYEDVQAVDEAMDILIDNRYLNDENFAYERIRTRANLSKWGKRRIMTELKNKGVAENIIAAAFERFESGDEERLGEEYNWQQEATELLLRKYGPFPQNLYDDASHADGWDEKQECLKKIQKEKAKRINFLLRRGYSSEQAIKAFEGT